MDQVASWVGLRSEATKRHRRTKRKDGLCGYGGCKTPCKTYLCDLHRPGAAVAQAKFRKTGGYSG